MPTHTRLIALALMTAFPFADSFALAADPLARVPLRQIKVGGEIGRRIDVTVANNLLAINIDKDFLQPFREPPAKGVYVGLGKLIDSLSRLAAHTSDQRLLALRRHVIESVVSFQGPDGYIGTFKPENRVRRLWDVHEMSYLIYGLLTDARLFDNRESLIAAKRLADYMISQLETHPDRVPTDSGVSLHAGFTGMEAALLELSEQTGAPRYRDFAVQYRQMFEWDLPIRLGRSADIMNHVYAYLCRCAAQLRLQRTSPDDRLLARSKDALDFLVRGNGLVITGACGDHECWHNSQAGTMNLGETCATAYLIRWLDEQLRLTGDARLGDLMERAIYNALFAAQSPDGRRIRYYIPFDGPRQYYPADSYCCPNNYRRIIAELPQMICYRTTDGVLLNLYAQSKAAVNLDNAVSLTLRQETNYPTSGKVAIHLEPSRPHRFAVKLRIPRWCKQATATINGEDNDKRTAPGGTLLVIDREWKTGDRIELNLPMALRFVKGRVNQAGRVAVMYGPTVFCLNPKLNPEVAGMDLRLLTASPSTLQGPTPDESVRPGGLACTLQAWPPGAWYPSAESKLRLKLTEFADPDGVAAYLFVPDPVDPLFVDDELVVP